MSSKVVRDAFELAFEAEFPTLNLQYTDNEEPDRTTLPEQWSVLDFIPSGEVRISLGKIACRRESGVIIVTVFVPAGTGNDAVIVFAESVRTFFRDWSDPTMKILITEVSPPDSGEASDGRWYASSVSLSYNYDIHI